MLQRSRAPFSSGAAITVRLWNASVKLCQQVSSDCRQTFASGQPDKLLSATFS